MASRTTQTEVNSRGQGGGLRGAAAALSPQASPSLISCYCYSHYFPVNAKRRENQPKEPVWFGGLVVGLLVGFFFQQL